MAFGEQFVQCPAFRAELMIMQEFATQRQARRLAEYAAWMPIPTTSMLKQNRQN